MRFEGDILAKTTCALKMNRENVAVILGDKGRITVEMPWHCPGTIRIELDEKGSVQEIAMPKLRPLFAYEIDSFTNEMRGRPIAADAVAMRFDDTLGNMKALDWWRAEIGLGYEADAVR